jgi:hypothetical protein
VCHNHWHYILLSICFTYYRQSYYSCTLCIYLHDKTLNYFLTIRFVVKYLTIIEWGWARYEELSSPKFAVINRSRRLRLITANWGLDNSSYYMAFQNSLFWLADKRSVKTHIRTVVRIFRIWTGIPDVVYLAGNFCFANRKNFCFLIFQLCVIKIYR